MKTSAGAGVTHMRLRKLGHQRKKAGIRQLTAALIEEFRCSFGDRLSTAEAVRQQHGKDQTYHEGALPDAVIFAHSTEEVQTIVQRCAATGTAVVPFGTGTSLEGHIAALKGGVSIDLSAMNRILEVNEGDLDCRVQAGVTRKALNEDLRHTGLFFPIDPGADASIGGMAATRASGTNAVRYGTMRENVLGLTVVTADGNIVRTGGRARKSSAGYDLTHLLVGSEGTLGVITEIALRLQPIPQAMSAAVCSFATLKGAVDTVIEIIQMGIPVARIELLDDIQIDAVNQYNKFDYPLLPTLFFEFHGSDSGVAEQAEMAGEIASENGGSGFQWSTQAEERNRLWQARHDVFWATKAYRPGFGAWSTDVCVPISALSDVILETRADIDKAGLCAPIVGHVGDGNFHVLFLMDPDDPEALAKAKKVNAAMLTRAMQAGGTCTGEHGIGYGKIDYLEQEHPSALPMMRAVKRALDPNNIMNPGKIFRLDERN